MSLAKLFTTWTERLQNAANVKSVFGDPIEAQGRTLVPVARVCYGFGAGQANRESGDDSSDDSAKKGGGGGGGASARPLGVLEVTAEGTRFISAPGNGKLYGGIAVGVLLGLWLGRRRRKTK
jgi:MYXO-CTERM domain-containing protein